MDNYTEMKHKEAIEWLIEVANSGMLGSEEVELISLCKKDSKYLSRMFDIVGNVCNEFPEFRVVFVRNLIHNGDGLPYTIINVGKKKN